MPACFIREDQLAKDERVIEIHICRPAGWEALSEMLSESQQVFAKARHFTGKAGQRVQMPGEDGQINCVLFGAGHAEGDSDGPIRLGGLSAALSDGPYRIASLPEDWAMAEAAIGWGLGAYKFDRYLDNKYTPPKLVIDAAHNPEETGALIAATHLGRDLINTPAGDMGPEALAGAAKSMAERHEADYRETVGEALLEQNYPMIHAVGRAAHQAPRLVEIEWGDPDHPRLAIIGKGITFDTGGLNIKSATGARLMKKDMGGAAHAIAMADIIMATRLPVRLHMLIAIAENAISGDAYRPGDVLNSRAGLTVEIDNTDAEGRLVLGDALARAAEDDPVLMIDFATLTGAARVALGPTLPPFYSNREAPVQALLDKARDYKDPIWRMPLWQPYNAMLNSPIATMKNAGGSFAGSVTAALFLERFVGGKPWMHLDVYGWTPSRNPGHPAGGEVFALRALYHWLRAGGLNGDFSR